MRTSFCSKSYETSGVSGHAAAIVSHCLASTMLVIIRKLFAFLSSLWALADIVLDTVTVIRFRSMCEVNI